MINKRNLLGKVPEELGTKDAIHAAIVSVRAASLIKPGTRCGLNANREAIPAENGCGVADPFRKEAITRGQYFWLLLCQDEIPNVQHVWQHPEIDFAPPTVEVKLNSTLKRQAEEFGVSYEQLMAACAYVVGKDDSAPYPGTKTAEELEKAMDDSDSHDMWYEWSEESGHEFENVGSACCPEYNYPEHSIFKV